MYYYIFLKYKTTSSTSKATIKFMGNGNTNLLLKYFRLLISHWYTEEFVMQQRIKITCILKKQSIYINY